jgi:hypothetical protein
MAASENSLGKFEACERRYQAFALDRLFAETVGLIRTEPNAKIIWFRRPPA